MPGHHAALPAAPAREIHVARQPVLDADLALLGYEILVDGVGAVVEALSEIGLDALTGGYAAWLPVDRELLVDIGLPPVRSDRVVLQVDPGPEPDPELEEAVCRLAAQGVCIALAGTLRPGLERLLDAVWGLKIDLAEHGRAELRTLVASVGRRELELIATSVETGSDLARCRKLGFTAFQGRVLAEPEIVPGRAVPTARLEALGSLVSLSAGADFEELERMIVRDVGMSHKLLRYANSALFFPSQRVASVHEAMVILGARAVQRFATVLVITGVRDQPHALLVTALVRAHMCEQLADEPERRDRAFTVGMFSVINRLLGMPMREALEALPLSEDVVAALLRGEGPEGRNLRVVLAWELGDFSAAETVTGGTSRVARAYRNAVAWADGTAGALR
jgi:EAL and modified HD-GYP domain-containing signal transduction protein